jgi:putative toxin-antitoxin system antitoxin component (TIGR02293 family)
MANPAIAASIYEKLGGGQVFEARLATDVDLARVVHRGIPVRALNFTSLSKDEINRLVINIRTLRHRRSKGEALTPDETDKLVRLTRIQSIAEDVFEDSDKAHRWLRQPLNILDDQTPLEFASSEPGARVVEQLLAKIEWGAAA